jgi:hypothetical protein
MEYLHNSITPGLFPDGLTLPQALAAVRVLAKLHAATDQSKPGTWSEDLGTSMIIGSNCCGSSAGYICECPSVAGEAIGHLRALGGFNDLLHAVYMDGLDTLGQYHAPLLAEESARWGTIGRGAQVMQVCAWW